MNFILIVTGYIVGSIPTGYLIAKWLGSIDIKNHGSGNIGATNLTRVMGKKYGILTLLGDGFKALLYVFFVKWFLGVDEGRTEIMVICATALALLLGNCYSVFLRLNGGKGGVTTYGVFLPLAPAPSIAAILSYIIMAKATRISAIGTLSSVFVLSLTIYLIDDNGTSPYYFNLSLAFFLIVWIRHRNNIKEIYCKLINKNKD